ncbi:MAG TPA: DUF4388 domain-containing protein [Firmicutes bacterium]|uniref:PatA-like N-terminal domain-containing protein n=1 Tax=candidate division TA06 bacterium TaxID=2250710 RepID=A0A660S6F3_UNCT6|nr:MAG: hypothetical protein DRP44_06345 [candidate division TA06 bacterium]HFD04895.1 DUF4388 domain-containing protein [Bacillota bacterium]
MGFKTYIDDANLTEVLYFLNYFRKTGKLSIDTAEGEGFVYIDSGKIYHAFYKGKKGAEALYLIALVEEGEFKFKTGEKTDEKTFSDESGNIITEIERRKKEIHDFVKQLPPFDTVLAKTTKLPQGGKISMRKTDWRVLLLVNGKRTLRQIIEISDINIIDVYAALVWLIKNGFVYDKNIVENSMKRIVEKANKFLKAYGAFDIDINNWYDYIKKKLEETEQYKGQIELFSFGPQGMAINMNKLYLVNVDEIKGIDDIIERVLYEKAIEELGPMLAKRKYAEVKKEYE